MRKQIVSTLLEVRKPVDGGEAKREELHSFVPGKLTLERCHKAAVEKTSSTAI